MTAKHSPDLPLDTLQEWLDRHLLELSRARDQHRANLRRNHHGRSLTLAQAEADDREVELENARRTVDALDRLWRDIQHCTAAPALSPRIEAARHAAATVLTNADHSAA